MSQRDSGAEALAVLDAAPHLPTAPPALCQFHLARMMALLQLGYEPKAQAAMADFAALGPTPPALAPLWHWRHVLLAQLRHDEPAVRAAAVEISASIPQMDTVNCGTGSRRRDKRAVTAPDA
jgi:hypothetical protein